MLVLTRRTDESIVIGDNIVITILSVEGDKVKIGITAPREVTVLRHELWEAIQEQNQIAKKLTETPDTPGIESLRKFLASETGAEKGEEKDEPEGPGRPSGTRSERSEKKNPKQPPQKE